METYQSDSLCKCRRKCEQDIDHRIEPLYEPLVAFTDFFEDFCMLSKNAQDSIGRIAAVELDRKWMGIEVMFCQFLVLFRCDFKDRDKIGGGRACRCRLYCGHISQARLINDGNNVWV